MIQQKPQMSGTRVNGWVTVVGVGCLFASLGVGVAAEDQDTQQPNPFQALLQAAPSTAEKTDQAQNPAWPAATKDSQELGNLFKNMLTQPQDEKAQQEARKRFEERLKALSQQATAATPTPSTAPVTGQPPKPVPQPPVDAQTLRTEIDALQLGPDAPAENFVKRDTVLGEIIQLEDPVVRDELLDRLADRERQQNGAAAVASPPANPGLVGHLEEFEGNGVSEETGGETDTRASPSGEPGMMRRRPRLPQEPPEGETAP